MEGILGALGVAELGVITRSVSWPSTAVIDVPPSLTAPVLLARDSDVFVDVRTAISGGGGARDGGSNVCGMRGTLGPGDSLLCSGSARRNTEEMGNDLP